ncbi:hypothetical protein [Paenibacillus sp. YIM B09110]|uniref:hypothetical protein n=1 Tax=Paenibacillus sp. YIM B09110 TaxID=3126102 RepID=UPI00301E6094
MVDNITDKLIRLEFEKNGDDALSHKEIENLISILPVNKHGYRISISFGKDHSEYPRKVSTIGIILDQNKWPGYCHVDFDYDYLCDPYRGKRHEARTSIIEESQ